MQPVITDRAAIEFTPALYGAVAAGYPLDMAVTEARKAIYAKSPLEWATPVLYMQNDDARLLGTESELMTTTKTASEDPAGVSVHMNAAVSGHGRVYQAGGDQYISGK